MGRCLLPMGSFHYHLPGILRAWHFRDRLQLLTPGAGKHRWVDSRGETSGRGRTVCFPPRRQSRSLGTAQHGMGGDSIDSTVRTAGCGALELLQPPAGPEQGRKCACAQRRKGGKPCVEASDVGSAVTPVWLTGAELLQALSEE